MGVRIQLVWTRDLRSDALHETRSPTQLSVSDGHRERSTWTYRFEPNGAATRVTLEVEYDVPQNMLARYASQGTLEKMNQERAAEALANLKGLLED